MIELEDVLGREAEIHTEAGYTIQNHMIDGVDIRIVGHLGNLTQMIVYASDWCFMSGYNTTHNLGYLIKAFVELFDLDKEDGVCLSDLKRIPCRIVIGPQGQCVGFGHFMKDKFVYISDFIRIDS